MQDLHPAPNLHSRQPYPSHRLLDVRKVYTPIDLAVSSSTASAAVADLNGSLIPQSGTYDTVSVIFTP